MNNFKDTFETMRTSEEHMKALDYEKWHKQIPYISFPAGWKVKIDFPRTGAMVRFRVCLVPNLEEDVSIYLDCDEILGMYGGPYWEVYPHRGDTFRCGMNETDRLIEAIAESLVEVTPRNEILKMKLDNMLEKDEH